METIFQVSLVAATLLCTLVAGFVFAFAVVVMPGIRALGDGEFLKAFQVMDRVIQNNQPIFMLVWLGSAVALLAPVEQHGAGPGDRRDGRAGTEGGPGSVRVSMELFQLDEDRSGKPRVGVAHDRSAQAVAARRHGDYLPARRSWPRCSWPRSFPPWPTVTAITAPGRAAAPVGRRLLDEGAFEETVD